MKVEPLRAWHSRFSRSRAETLLRVLPAAIWLAMIHFVSSREADELPSFHIDDRVAHFIEYFILGVLLMLALTAARGLESRQLMKAGIATALAVALGMVDEWHQSFVPGRDSSWKDVLFDGLGAMAASILIAWLVERRYGQRDGEVLAPETGR